MQFTHVISDFVLFAIGIYVFFRYLFKLNLSDTILWESFVLSVSVSALFGSLFFMGFDWAKDFSKFFQNAASIAGAFGLVVASGLLVFNKSISRPNSYIALGFGLLLFGLAEIFKIRIIHDFVPKIGLLLVLCLGVVALINSKFKIGIYLILGVLCFAVAVFRGALFPAGEYLIEVLHYLTAVGLLFLGLAASQKSYKENFGI